MATYDTLTDAQMEAKLTAGDAYGIDAFTVRSAILTVRDRAPATSGLTATVDELNILDGATLTVAELNILDGVTATAAEINGAADVSSRLVAIPDAATYVALAANSGKTHIIPNLTADITIDLPTPAAGLEYRFMYGGVAADAQDWIIDTLSNTNFYMGGVVHCDSDAGEVADEMIPVFPDGNSNSILTVLTPQGGTWVYVICDGTNWFVNGMIVSASASAAAFTDQA